MWHRATVAAVVAGAPEEYGAIVYDASAVRKLISQLRSPGIHLRVAYEAGPTAYAVYLELTRMGIECVVVALSLIPVRPGDRVKTEMP